MKKNAFNSVLFKRTKNAYLPEIDAYKKYLQNHLPHIKVFDSREVSSEKADVHWLFTGMDIGISCSARCIVHEYNSLSTNPCGSLKNSIKAFVNRKPDRRIFLNKTVKDGFSFQDDVPFKLRDMGIGADFFRPRQNLEYDFIYVGSMDRSSVMVPFLEHFKNYMRGKTLMLVGRVGNDLMERFSSAQNIIFNGPADYADIPSFLSKARYGLNLMPDAYPFNMQTSTKMLEYCAAGLPVVSSDYTWAQEFSRERRAGIFWLKKDLSNLRGNSLDAYNFIVPSVDDLKWDKVIENSGVFDFLK